MLDTYHGKTANGIPPSTPTIPQTSSSEVDLENRLDSLVKAAPVMLFMKGTPAAPQCGFSKTLVGLLRERNVRYGFFNILADEDVRSGKSLLKLQRKNVLVYLHCTLGLKEKADWPTFPQLWVGGEFAGGLDIVKDMIETDQFDELVKGANT